MNVINADYSTVVIEQQMRKFPQMRWVVMDALDTKLEDGSVPVIVDKSLIDTVLCYTNRLKFNKLFLALTISLTPPIATISQQKIVSFVSEMHRILAPGGRYITFSLHPITESLQHFQKEMYGWRISAYNV
jgi:ubiquinone/menaquinone biosynthesis C-methylase UbiE